MKTYRYKRCTKRDLEMIIRLNNEGVSISGIARITEISKTHVINKIRQIAKETKQAMIAEEQQEYEVDEMHTFIGNKTNHCYIAYAISRLSKRVIDFVVGGRTKENIGKVVDSVKNLNPKKIFTDKLNVYPGLIEKSTHTASSYKINHIERFNLTLRTHLKRLSRKTICYSKSKEMLENCLRIYLWGTL